MALSPGARLGPYEIIGPLGAGGMGEVYRARDTRLGRDVAIKVLPQHLSSNPEIRARFEREAKTVSSLNHPNICTLFDVGRSAGEAGSGDIDYLVMELVEGETLSQRIGRVGALPVAEVLKLGAQIADALDRAHRAGVIHRDLKPGNVMLTKSSAKLMDFGLARATGLASPGGSGGGSIPGLTQSPTVAAPLTAEGTIVGTFQYMAPEQLEGKEADARTDLWALGCVLYEMATGRRAFEGRSQATLISAIISSEPRSLLELAPLTPPALDRALQQCLAKDPDDRWQSAGDIRRELQWIAGSSATGSSAMAPAATARARRAAPAWLAAWALFATLAFGVALWMLARTPHGRAGAAVLELATAPGALLSTEPADLAISPDGHMLAYVGADTAGVAHLWVRALDSPNARMIPETDRAQHPFWSPDSRWIAYFTTGEGAALYKVPVGDGSPVRLCDAEWSRGGAWGRHGDILFSPAPTSPIFRISENGGAVTAATTLDSALNETSHRQPSFLADGEHFVFVALPATEHGWRLMLGSLHSRSLKKLGIVMSAATWIEPGYLLFDRDGKVVAQRLDPARKELVGDVVPISNTAPRTPEDATRIATGSDDGRIAILKRDPPPSKLEWVSRSGTPIGDPMLRGDSFVSVLLSHDGHRAAVARLINRFAAQVVRVDLDRGITAALTDPREYYYAGCWSPDDRTLAVTGVRTGGHEEVALMPADGSAPPRVLATNQLQFKTPCAWSPDGKSLVFNAILRGSGRDLLVTDAEHGGAPRTLVSDPGDQLFCDFSPDGRWVTYDSDETGTGQIFARRFADGSGKLQLTTVGGSEPRWVAQGREVIFIGNDRRSFYAVPLEPGRDPTPQPARLLFRMSYDVELYCWDVAEDGTRFLLLAPDATPRDPSTTIVVNWPALLERR